MLTKKDQMHYLTIAENVPEDKRTREAESKMSRVLDKILDEIKDVGLWLEIDSTIGELILAHEFRGYEIGRRDQADV